MALITYTDKETLNSNPNVPIVNKVQADDMNEIKQVVNDNYNALAPNIITAYLTADTSKTAQSGTIGLDGSVSVGNKLSFSSSTHKITIGAGVSKVKISGNMRISTSTNTAIGVNLNIFKNDSIYSASNRTQLAGNGYDGIAVAPSVISVAENDTITLAYWKGNSTQAISILGNDYGATYLTVEVVE